MPGMLPDGRTENRWLQAIPRQSTHFSLLPFYLHVSRQTDG
jgi:hypothetical protein